MQVHRPKTLDDALTTLAQGNGKLRPIAGGTDLLVSWPHRDSESMNLLDLSLLTHDLQPMQLTSDELILGALTTYWDVIQSAEITAAFPLLTIAAKQVGAVQIQTRGTWAGNIANGSPAADGVPVMMAYDAVVILASKSGRREVPLDQYFTDYKQSVRRPDELIVAIRIPRRCRSVEWFHKVGSRSAQTIAKVSAAVVQDNQGWRVVAGSVGPFVRRCPHMEAALTAGQSFAEPADVQRIIQQDVSPIDDIRSTAEYRLNVLARILYFGLNTSPPLHPPA